MDPTVAVTQAQVSTVALVQILGRSGLELILVSELKLLLTPDMVAHMGLDMAHRLATARLGIQVDTV